jgi:protein-disulfide isomerase
MDQREEDLKKGTSLLFLLSGLSLIPSIYLAFISYAVLKTVCIMCSLTYLINIGIFVACWNAFRSSQAKMDVKNSLFALPQSYWIVTIVLVLLQLISGKIVNTMISATDEELDDKTIGMFVSRHFSGPTFNFDLQNVPFYGPADAPVTLVEYSDFQCPFCAKSALTMPSLITDYRAKVRVVFKNYPLDPSCNVEMKNGGHQHACFAAKTGWCVFKLKGSESFFSYKSTAFENQEGASEAKYTEWAMAQGIEKDALSACVNDFETLNVIKAQIAEGKAAGVQGTPSIFLNGKSLEAGFVPKIFKAVMDKY